MSAELSPELLAGGLRTVGLVPERDEPVAPAPGGAATLDDLRVHPVLRYATADEAEQYRRIMRVLFLEHQAFALRLRPEQVADRLRERYGLRLDPDTLEARLAALADWGAVDREHDASLARSAAEWRRNRFTYDVTPAGRLTEGLLASLDRLGREHGRLEADRIPTIRDALSRLADELEKEASDGTELRDLLERALGGVSALHEGALAFMTQLGALIRQVEQVDENEFERGKSALIEHLQRFRRDRQRSSHEVLDALDRIDGERLVALIADAEEFVALPGGQGVAEQRARRADELLRRWRGVRAWFMGDDTAGSPWRSLNNAVVDAIRAVLEIAERLVERRLERVDRATVYLHLAAQAATAPPGEAAAWLRAALGLAQPRHVLIPEEDPEQVADRGATSWYQAPPAPVVAHLRTPGRAAPGRGRGAPIADLRAARAGHDARRRAERAELEALLRRFAERGPLRLSALAKVDEREFAHLRAWISRAYEAPPSGGVRSLISSDGLAEIRLVEPADGARATLTTPLGRLDAPDYRLEVVLR